MIIYKRENITVFQSYIYMTNSSVIECKDLVLVVDPAFLPTEIKEIREYVNSIKDSRPIYLLFTHSDYDHILGYGAFPSAITISSIALDERKDKEGIIEEIKQFDDKYYLLRDYDLKYPDINIKIYEDGQEIKVGETIIKFYMAPGHTEDSIFTIVQNAGIFLSGDYLSNLEFPYIYFSSKEYENTLLKVEYLLENEVINLLVPGHGKPCEETKEIRHRQMDSLKYIRALRKAIIKKDKKTIDSLIEEYIFPISMKDYHIENQVIIKKELGK
jgi:hydroxyacylglutathione hydrolase